MTRRMDVWADTVDDNILGQRDSLRLTSSPADQHALLLQSAARSGFWKYYISSRSAFLAGSPHALVNLRHQKL
jgi:hypothetical protein